MIRRYSITGNVNSVSIDCGGVAEGTPRPTFLDVAERAAVNQMRIGFSGSLRIGTESERFNEERSQREGMSF